MPTYEVVSGDTVWALTRRALTEQYGRVPTNREILEVVNQVQVPSGNVDMIYPGEQITIPVGPGYEGGEGPGGGGAGGGGGTPGQTPNLPGGVRPEPGRPDGGIYTPIDPPYAGGMPGGGRQYPIPPAVRDPRPIPGGSPGGAVNAPAGGRPGGQRPPLAGGAVNAPAGGRTSEPTVEEQAGALWVNGNTPGRQALVDRFGFDPVERYGSQFRPAPFELDKYPESTYALGGLTAAALAGAAAPSAFRTAAPFVRGLYTRSYPAPAGGFGEAQRRALMGTGYAY